MKDGLKKLFAPPYSGLVGGISVIVGVAAEFTKPATAPVLVKVFGEQWTSSLVSICLLIALVSRVPQVKALLDRRGQS